MVKSESIVSLAKQIAGENWGYIYGTAGVTWTENQQNILVKKMVTKYGSGWITNANAEKDKFYISARYGSRWCNHMVADCSGLVVYIGKKLGFTVSHGSNSIWKNSLSEKGAIHDPSQVLPGDLVFKLRYVNDYYHVGIYVGDGKVVEAKGTLSGVVYSDLSVWTHYGRLKDVTYSLEVIPMEHYDAVVDVPNNGTVNVRASTSMSAKKLGTIREGERVVVLAESGDWAKVQYVIDGYVRREFLRKA